MKTLVLPLITVFLLGCSKTGDPAPMATPKLEDLRGQWVVINYWAQWCKPCIEEIPELNALYRTYDDVTVLGVNYDGATGADLARQVEALGVEFPILEEDPSAQLDIPRPVVLPTTLIVGPNGELTDTLLGPQTLETLAAATQKTEE